ncbi:hypothetical protein COCMIDRAFT_40186 [Bipolaris oryzae ATCC 44560]|uniref:Uncharacterized protein n=1 Tax=Bipolaris oryzae ATCC 44560 TaxID=930090 RepID=W6YVY2_COCMI|nr:uncharacterized protein COCMIDRAFT_40186 [Bipolaris oryzae ATCC 44560]EUC41685.1 hypothetical protein COCMIDRAFT_40186 [Bipolaris oryzae ATCC 44560]
MHPLVAIANDSQAASLRATLNGDPPVPGFLAPSACRRHHRPSGPRHPSLHSRSTLQLQQPHPPARHVHGVRVRTPIDGAVLCDSMLPCVKPSRAPSGACSDYLRRPAPQQRPAWAKPSQRRRAVRRGSRWLHASKARGVRGDPGCATIEMGSIGRSTAAVRPFRLASAAALARPPTSPPQLTAPRHASFFGPTADTRLHRASCLPLSTAARLPLPCPLLQPVQCILSRGCAPFATSGPLASIHAAPIGQKRSRT